MEQDFLAAAREEEARLVARLELVRSVIRGYTTASTVQAVVTNAPSDRRRKGNRTRTSMSAVVIGATQEFLSYLGRRAESAEIADEMIRRNIYIPGQKPSSVISSYLSTSPLFDNVRGEGYGLTTWKPLPYLETTIQTASSVSGDAV